MSVASAPPIADLIPHAGAMCLLDHVLHWDAQDIHACSAWPRAGHSHPLARATQLHAVHLAEYGAQASAVHGALLARQHSAEAVRPGRLVSLREVVLTTDYIDLAHGRLDVHAQCLYAQGRGAQYLFRVEQNGQLLGSGRLAVIHADTSDT